MWRERMEVLLSRTMKWGAELWFYAPFHRSIQQREDVGVMRCASLLLEVLLEIVMCWS